MIILLLDNDTAKNAKYLADNNLRQQIKTIAQILCQIHFQWIDYHAETIGDANHLADKIPLKDEKVFDGRRNDYADWGYQCRANYLKLLNMGLACCEEYNYRFGLNVEHKLFKVILWARNNVPQFCSYIYEGDEWPPEAAPEKPFPLGMSKKHIAMYYWYPEDKRDDAPDAIVQSYRNYYCSKLPKDAKWTRREKPEWLTEDK